MQKIQTHLTGEIISTNSAEAFSLHKKSAFGEPKTGKIQYSLSEALFLIEKNKIEVMQKNKKISKEELIKKFQRIDKKNSN